jgi:Na+-transporting NADH:ubiquinone oxidoreductase subunit C
MPNDSIQKTLFVAIALCLVCSVMVSGAAVLLKPTQVANQALDVKKNILDAAGLLREGANIEEAFQQIQIRIVDLDSGEYADDIDAASYDARAASKDPALSEPVPADQDIAKIKRQAQYAKVYRVEENGELKTLILPVHGYGLWSTMYAFLALEPDLNTIKDFKFYEQAETAGLGSEVANPDWQALWKGKKIFDEQGQVNIEVIKGSVDSGSPNAKYEVDGLAGSTLTSRGVTNLLHYWLGKNGFGPYLNRLRQERG